MRPQRPSAPGESCARNGDETYCVSSVLKPQFGNSYGPENLFKGPASSAWVEGQQGNGVGEWITVEFEGMRTVRSIIVRNGYQKSNDIFGKNNRVRHLRAVFSQGETQTLTLQDRSGSESLMLPKPVKAYWVKFIIDDVWAGNKYTGHRDYEAGGQFGAGAVIRATPGASILGRIVLAAICAASCLASAAAQAQKLPAGFVYLRDVDPTIIQDIRYAGSNNFVGRPLRGYEAAECVVKREVGALLKSVQEELALQNLSLKMFDCYRPTRAVADMVAWSRDGKETLARKRYNPAFSKADLFRLGYIADPFGPFHRRRARSHSGRSEGRQFGHLRSRQGLWRLHRQREPSRAGRQRRHGHRLRLFRRQVAHGGEIHHRSPAPLAGEAGSGDGAARICKLFEGVVALFAAGSGRAGL